jgi:hypothetical protein
MVSGGQILLRAVPNNAKSLNNNGDLFLDCANACNLPFYVTVQSHQFSQRSVATSDFKATNPGPLTLTVNGRSGWLPGKNQVKPFCVGEWSPAATGNCVLDVRVDVLDSTGSMRSHNPEEDVMVK